MRQASQQHTGYDDIIVVGGVVSSTGISMLKSICDIGLASVGGSAMGIQDDILTPGVVLFLLLGPTKTFHAHTSPVSLCICVFIVTFSYTYP